MPSFILRNSEELFRMEDSRCDCMEQTHNVHANKILADIINRQVKTILLVFPSGVVCTPCDSTSKEGKVKIAIRSLTMGYKIGKNCDDTAHNYFPAHWMLRIIIGVRRFLKLCKVEEDDIDNAFQGMKLSK